MKKTNSNSLDWAVVTGASKGLGYCYCEELLKLGYNVVAVARDTTPVTVLQQKYPTQTIKMINYDLSNLENCEKLFNDVAKDNVTILINNAGYG
ncbi:SDR family NAD(P)-dependent oxidoreductase, partial [Spiroplasma phoeniceum]|uniref:SDR family NAD(P)-dependent oxidoreductase n=1 Tax=Spiroplasma phoeniceum TaxID=47835 RepID=UPI003364B875